jgi:RNA polymerase sigma-70 factor (sigma-E family)
VTTELADPPDTAPTDPPPTDPAHDFEALVAATGDRMLQTALLLTGDRQAAEDLVQSTFAQVYSRWRLVARADNPVAYVRTILTRQFLSERRRRRVREVPLTHDLDAPARHSDPTVRLSLLEALATLPPQDRAVLVLRFFHDLSFAEVGQQTGLSETASRTRAHRALARLRTRFPNLADTPDTPDTTDPTDPADDPAR